MAPDAGGPSVKAATLAAGRLESSFTRTGSPLLPTRLASGSVPPATAPSRTTPQKRRAELSADRDSDSSLSEFEGETADSDAETERLHISPQKQRPGMMVQHTTSSSTVTASPMAFEIAVARDDLHRSVTHEAADERAATSAPATPTRSPSKKRKRDENSLTPLTLLGSPDEKPAAVPPPKKKLHERDAIESEKSKPKETPATNGDAQLPKKAQNGSDDCSRNDSDNGDSNNHNDADLARDDDPDAENHDETPPAPAEETGDRPDVSREDDEGL